MTPLPSYSVTIKRNISSIYEPSKLWKNGSTLNVLFLGGTEEQKNAVKKSAPEWSKYANITFNFFNKGEIKKRKAHISIHFEDKCSGNNSYVGKDSKGKYPSMCLFNINQYTILHEFGHALGLRHEHAHPDFGDKLNENYIDECMHITSKNESGWSAQKCKDAYEPYLGDAILGEYDSYSVMHYTIEETYLKEEYKHKIYGSIGFLSLEDRKAIMDMYPDKIDALDPNEEYQKTFQQYHVNHACKVVDLGKLGQYGNASIDECEEGARYSVYTQEIRGNEIVWEQFEYRHKCYQDEYDAMRDLKVMNFCKYKEEEIKKKQEEIKTSTAQK